MTTIIKTKSWNKKRNLQKGRHLQKLADSMLAKGDTGTKYKKIRTAAEFHLGFWKHQRSVSRRYGVTPTKRYRSQTDAFFPKKCTEVSCPYLPAGSAACIYKEHECPTKNTP